jgi:hypothetical protein
MKLAAAAGCNKDKDITLPILHQKSSVAGCCAAGQRKFESFLEVIHTKLSLHLLVFRRLKDSFHSQFKIAM